MSYLLWNELSTYIPRLLYGGNNLRRHHLHHYRHQTQDHPLRHNFQHIDGLKEMFRSLITFYVCLMFTNLTIWLRAGLAITSSLDQKDTKFTVYFPLLTSHVPWYEGPRKQFSNL